MHRLIVLCLLLLSSSLPTDPPPGGEPANESALAERVKTHINERMHEMCENVVLKRIPGETFRGHADFLSGVHVDLEVTLVNDAIQYRFLERPRSGPQPMQARPEDLETLIVQLETEIDRLMALCLRAGIDPTPPRAEEDTMAVPNGPRVPVEPSEAVPETVGEDEPDPIEKYPQFTWRLYDALEKDMTYGEVVDILGDEGQAISGSFFDNAENDIVVWTNPDDSHICVVFRNGQVLVKTQFGLPETAAPPPY